MDFAAALKKLEKETTTSNNTSSSSQQQQQRDGSRSNSRGNGGGRGGAIRGRGDYYGQLQQQQRPHGGGTGGDRGNYYGGGGGDRRRGRSEYNDTPGGSNNDRTRNQRPRYNNMHQGQHHRGGRGRGRGDYDRGNGGSSSSNNNNGNSWPLEEMHRFGYHVSSIPYHHRRNNNNNMKPPNDLGHRPFHIALLCICIDSLPYIHLWHEWAQTGNNDAHVSLLVHAKYPDKIVAQAKREEAAAEGNTSRSSNSHHGPACMVRDRLLTKPPRLGRGNSYADPEYITHTPAWGSIQITRAMLELLTAASVIGTLRDTERSDIRFMSQRFLLKKKDDNKNCILPNDIPPIDKFIFISETCVPVQTLQECEMALFGDKTLYTSLSCKDEKEMPTSSSTITPWEVSWVNARHPQTSPGTPRNKYERDQFHNIHDIIPIEYRWKADQWHCLSRPHALAILDLDAHLRPHLQLWNSFTRINASDEMYFPTALSILGILNTDDVVSTLSSSTSKIGNNNNPNNTANDETNDQKQPNMESSDNSAASAPTAVTAATATSSSSAAAASATPASIMTPTTTRNGSIALRPITYTDWSEGMRNPATFSNGMRDFCKIAKLARQQGSLFARKFALVSPSAVAAAAANNNNSGKAVVVVEQTGQITASEWRNEVERMASDAAAAAVKAQETKEAAAATTMKSSETGDAVKEADSS